MSCGRFSFVTSRPSAKNPPPNLEDAMRKLHECIKGACLVCGGTVKNWRYKHCSVSCKVISMRTCGGQFWNGQWYTIHTNGYLRKPDTRTYLHRDIWESVHGPIPSGMVVHHLNENKLDNNIANLEIIFSGAHTSMHHIGKPKPRPRADCTVNGCERKARGRNLCDLHHQRVKAFTRKGLLSVILSKSTSKP